MNLSLLSRLLGLVSILIGICMVFSLPWALPQCGGEWEHEQDGFYGLIAAMVVCFIVGMGLRYMGRRSQGDQLYRREAMAVVGLSWILATVLGALPYSFSATHRAPGVPMTVVDAMFESQSGFSTTGATVLTELQNPEVVPRTILFWRSSTHFLGGLGIIVLFVAILGQGSAGKALMRAEMPGPSHSSQQARMQHTAWVLVIVYTGLNAILTLLLMLEGLSVFDALCHAFGTMATGGFSTYNASVGYFMTNPQYDGPLIEMTLTFFMFLAGTNFMLLYAIFIWKPMRMFGDVEWRTYVGLILIATVVIVAFGLYHHDFEANGMIDTELVQAVPVEEDLDTPDVELINSDQHRTNQTLAQATRFSLFQVVSIMTTTGFCTDDFDVWCSFSRSVLLLLMFVGGCAGSTGGGLKVIRHILFSKTLRLEVEQAFHPNVVRPLRIAGKPVEDQSLRKNILVYFGLITAIFAASWLFTVTFEPDSTWSDYGHKHEHKMMDAASAVAATLNNIGPGFGVVGATQNYSNFTMPTKMLFIWLMMIGRLEIFVILVLFIPKFWRTQQPKKNAVAANYRQGGRLMQDHSQIFRVKLMHTLVLGICGLVVGGAGVIVAFASEDAIFSLWWMRLVTLVPLMIFLLGVDFTVAAFRERIKIHGEEVVLQSAFRQKRFCFSDVTALKWGTRANSFIVNARDKKFEISDSCYYRGDFNCITTLFRTRVPKERQYGWDVFCLASVQRLMIGPYRVDETVRDAIQKLADQGEFDALRALESKCEEKGKRSEQPIIPPDEYQDISDLLFGLKWNVSAGLRKLNHVTKPRNKMP